MFNLIKKGMIVVILIVATILLNVKTIHYNQAEVEYLSQNYQMLDLEKADFSLLQVDLNINKSVIMSELHGIKENTLLEYQLFTYLNKQNGIRFLLLEMSYSSAYLLNRYVQTGNEVYLNQVFSFYKGTTFWTKEDFQFFKDLYTYNQTLDEKITLIGIDIEHSVDSYEYLKGLNILNEDEINHLELNKKAREEVYQEEFDFQLRENYMYQNYQNLKKLYQIEQFFGQFGVTHCFKEVVNDFKSFAYYLNHNNENIDVIMSVYRNSQYLSTITSNDLVYYKKNVMTNYSKNSIDYFKADFIFFKLDQENSPYKNELIWFFKQYKIMNQETVTTDYFDYLLLIKDTNASTPMDKTNGFFEVMFDFLLN